MLTEKIASSFFAYCFTVLEYCFDFIERTHAFVAIGLLMVVVVGVHTFLGRRGDLALLSLIIVPAASAMAKMIVDFLALSKPRLKRPD